MGAGEEKLRSPLAGLPSSALQAKGSQFFTAVKGLPLEDKRAFAQTIVPEIDIDVYT